MDKLRNRSQPRLSTDPYNLAPSKATPTHCYFHPEKPVKKMPSGLRLLQSRFTLDDESDAQSPLKQ